MPRLDQIIPQPNSRELLPPLLASLAVSGKAKEAPPGLLPLVSPILRQRLQLVATDDWLSLLCWDQNVAAKLPSVVEKIHVEPHPASGEIEVEDPDQILYRRSDPETLHARLLLSEFGIIPAYLWCTGGEGGSRWLLAELRGIEDADDGTEWFQSLSEANEAGFRRKPSKSTSYPTDQPTSQAEPQQEADDDDDGSYWAAYDQTPNTRTPAQKRSPAPQTNNRTQIGPTQSELEYFARYASEVQPALDAHDPNEESPAAGESTLNGNTLNYSRAPQTEPLESSNLGPNGYDSSLPPPYVNGFGDESRTEHIESVDDTRHDALNHPRPSSSSSSRSVEKLEREAANHSQAELAIKQHISTDIKSLFRLARASGIDREEFERIIQRELEILPLLERDSD